MEISQDTGILIAGAVCLLVFLFVLIRSRPHLLVNFLFRSVFGLIGIWLTNGLLEAVGLSVRVGLGAAGFLAGGILGIPGLVLLYAVAFCSSL